MIALVLLALTVLAGVASAVGWTADTRDPAFSLGRLITGDHPAAAEETVAGQP